MNMNNFRAVGVKSCGKLYLVENEYGITPIVTKGGQWLDIEFLKNYCIASEPRDHPGAVREYRAI